MLPAARWHRPLLIVSIVALSWLGMMAVHESGHVLGAWLTGGRVAKVVLHPLTISRTDVAINPRPLFVVWAGPLFGVVFPLLAWLLALLVRARGAYLLRFFAGFCLIANGAYIGAGAWDGIGDCGVMRRHGSPLWVLVAFGLTTVPAGLLLWHRLGPQFGLGKDGRVSSRAAYFCIVSLVIVVAVECVFGGE